MFLNCCYNAHESCCTDSASGACSLVDTCAPGGVSLGEINAGNGIYLQVIHRSHSCSHAYLSSPHRLQLSSSPPPQWSPSPPLLIILPHSSSSQPLPPPRTPRVDSPEQRSEVQKGFTVHFGCYVLRLSWAIAVVNQSGNVLRTTTRQRRMFRRS